MRTRVLNHFHTFHPDAQAELDRLVGEERRITRAKAAQGDDVGRGPRRMSDRVPPTEGLDEELADVRAKMDEQRKVIASGVVRVHIKGLTRGEFRRLLAKHPPKDGDKLDERLGYDSDSFGDALIQACIVRTEDLDGEPVDNEWSKWADDMTNGQWEEFFTACMKLTNDGEPSFPQ
jgi:hypothetical protein